MDFSAVLLAAGRSTRMGRDKALLEIEGAPLWQRQRDLLASLGVREIFLSVRPEQEWSHRAPGFTGLLYDDLPNAGPMAGITAALERTTRPHVIVLAIDLPRMNADWFRDLLKNISPGVGTVGRRTDFFEPLAAIYPREMMPLFWEALAAAKYGLQPVLAQGVAEGKLLLREIGTSEASLFENWNEPTRAQA